MKIWTNIMLSIIAAALVAIAVKLGMPHKQRPTIFEVPAAEEVVPAEPKVYEV